MANITFSNTQTSFFKTLKEKVDNYFISHQLHPAGNSKLLLKSIFQVLTAILLYTILIFFTPHYSIALLLCCILGLNLAIIGFNIMHEGGHSSFSKYKWLNTTSAYFLNVLGGNTYFWKIKHNINHHTYTNIEGLDSDIDVQPFMRLHEHQPLHKYHKFQHLYWVLLYGISYFVWIFYHDFEKYFTGKIAYGTQPKVLETKEKVVFWITKFFYISVYIILPVIMLGWLPALIGFMIVSFVCGLAISVVFQLAHVVESTYFPEVTKENIVIDQEWAIHQISATANFATKNKILCWLLGGLNFQVEHHLFPKISHIHYPQINKLVKETCQEYNIPYLEYPTMQKAFLSHMSHIYSLGRF
jgi:linoleoyl-CoA desaturase